MNPEFKAQSEHFLIVNWDLTDFFRVFGLSVFLQKKPYYDPRCPVRYQGSRETPMRYSGERCGRGCVLPNVQQLKQMLIKNFPGRFVVQDFSRDIV